MLDVLTVSAKKASSVEALVSRDGIGMYVNSGSLMSFTHHGIELKNSRSDASAA